MTELRAVIVEDEPLARSRLRRLLEAGRGVSVVGEAADGIRAAAVIRETAPDLVFVDIRIPGKSGIGVVEELRPRPAVVFVTAFEEHAAKAFELEAVDYLVKPVTRDRLRQALRRARAACDEERLRPPVFFSRTGRRIRRVDSESVEYFEARGDYVGAWTEKGCTLLSTTLGDLEKALPVGDFVRVHRSYIVHRRFVREVRPHSGRRLEVVLEGGAVVVASRRRTPAVRAALRPPKPPD